MGLLFYMAVLSLAVLGGSFECDSKCQNGGQCNNGHTCSCIPGWTGDSCDKKETIFVGPYNKIWISDQCSTIRISNTLKNTRVVKTLSKWKILSEWKSECNQTHGCTALTVTDELYPVDLLNCTWPVPLPQTNSTSLQGYAIAEVCVTDSKCGIEGGFCIPESEACTNGFVPQGEGYCNKNYDKQIGCKCCLKPTVYMRDIENTIAFALRNRAPYNIDGPPTTKGGAYKTLNTTQQQALSNFTKALVHHLPLRSPLVNFLNCLSSWLSNSNEDSVPGHKLLNVIYKDCESETDLPEVREWFGCNNFDIPGMQQFRSYPCGVWTTFHAMTVNLRQEEQQDDPRILPTLHGMVNYFPWCNDCKADFIDMYNATKGSLMTKKGADMKTAEEVTMWLWRAHNIVTNRIAEQKTNPGRSQLQFPGIDQCPGCYRVRGSKESEVFNKPEVYKYLKEHYKKDAIVPDSSA